jgi:hypothetical protein
MILYAADASVHVQRGLHEYAGHTRRRAVDVHDGRSADDVMSRQIGARLPTVISSPDSGVTAVAAAGVLCAFPCVVDA